MNPVISQIEVDGILYDIVTQVLQSTGEDTERPMSQKAVTDVLLKIYHPGKNKYDKSKRTDKYTLNIHGVAVSSSEYSVSDYIKVSPDEQYIFSLNNAAVPGGITIVCFYDASMTFVSYVSAAKNITIPTNVAYLRFATTTVRMSDNMQLEQGTSITTYEPYKMVLANQAEVEALAANKFDKANVVSTTGGSTLLVLSQKAVTELFDGLSVRVNELYDSVSQIYRPGKNMYDKSTRTDDYTLSIHGAVAASSGYSVSDYIEIEPSTSYIFSLDNAAVPGGISIICFYDENKSFISYIGSTASITTPTNAAYLRFATSTVRMSGNMQLEQGTTFTTYEPYAVALVNQAEVDRNSANVAILMEDVEKLKRGVEDIYRPGKNMYDKTAKTDGYILLVSGRLKEETNYSVSDFIAVDENTNYVFSLSDQSFSGGMSIVCFYNSNQEGLSYVEGVTNITTPAGAAYVRFSTTTVRMNGDMQLEQGTVATGYSPYESVLANQATVDNLVKRTTESYVAYVSAGSFVSKVDGKLYAGASYGSTSYIGVPGGESIKIRGFNSVPNTNASTCAYDANFNFLGAIITDAVDNGNGKIVKLGTDVSYIRVTSAKTGSVSVEFIDKNIAKKVVEELPYDLGTLTTGQFIMKTNGAVAGGTGMYSTTDLIEVSVQHIRIVNPYLSGNAGICEYDKNGNFISCLLSDVEKGQYTVDLSVNAKYVRASVLNNNTNYMQIFPVDADETNTGSGSNVIVDAWMLATGKQVETPYSKVSKLGPTITFIDDDTASYNAVKRYHDVFVPFASQGARGCYAVVTDYMAYEMTDDGVFVRDEKGDRIPTDTSKLKDLLLQYEEEGFGMLFHAKWQDIYYMEGANRDIAEAETDYCKGMRKMREIGFLDYDYWVSPYGVMDAEIASMCKRHGSKCLMSTYNNTYIQLSGLNGKNESVNRYALPRCSFGNNSEQYAPGFTLDKLKEQIDACVLSNGWIIVTSHAAQWGEAYDDTQTPDEALASIIQYALNAGCTVKTFAEAYAERNSILMVNDIC